MSIKYPTLDNIELKAPLKVNIMITNRCNFDCEHCLINDNKKMDLPPKTIFKVVDQLSKNQVFEIGISGGEPFLRNDLFKILKHIDKRDIGIHLNSNGSLLHLNNNIKKLKKINNLSHLDITLHAVQPKVFHNFCNCAIFNIENVLKNLEELKKEGVNFNISRCLTKTNYQDTFVAINKLSKLGINEMYLMTFQPLGKGYRNFEKLFIPYCEFEKKIKKISLYASQFKFKIWAQKPYDFKSLNNREIKNPCFLSGCKAGRSKLTIWYDGNVIPCSFLYDKKFILGNIYNQKIGDIWNSKKKFDFIKNNNSKLDRFCEECKFYSFCKGGCLSNSFFLTKSTNLSDPLCPFKIN